MKKLALIFALFITTPAHAATQAEIQDSRAVEIRTRCFDLDSGKMRSYGGSGVGVDRNTVITAAHVSSPCLIPALIEVRRQSGDWIPAYVRKVSHRDDIAVLFVAGDLGAFHKIAFAPVPPSGQICMSVAAPARKRICGAVERKTALQVGWTFSHTANPTPGNSGSGVYDSKGRLVGILTQGKWCSPMKKKMCMGFASAIFGVRAELGL